MGVCGLLADPYVGRYVVASSQVTRGDDATSDPNAREIA